MASSFFAFNSLDHPLREIQREQKQRGLNKSRPDDGMRLKKSIVRIQFRGVQRDRSRKRMITRPQHQVLEKVSSRQGQRERT